MRRLLVLLASILLVSVFTAPSASAISPHFKKGSPTCTVGTQSTGVDPVTITVSCSGTINGLGLGDVNITNRPAGYASYQCVNPANHVAPGRANAPAPPDATTLSGVVPPDSHGTFTFNDLEATISAPSTVDPVTAGCPNANWTASNPTLHVTSVTLTVDQGGPVLLTACKTGTDLTGTFVLRPC